MSAPVKDFVLSDIFMETMMEWNEGGTRNLLLKGNDLYQRVGRRIQDGDILRIINFLVKHPEVISLELPHNEIGNCGIYNLMKHIKSQRNIKYLNLIGNKIGWKGIQHIVALGGDLPFYVLRLSGNKIGDEGGKLLSQLLYLDLPLKVLDVSDSHQTMSGIAYILTGLMYSRGGTDKLEIIDIGRPLQQYYHQICDAHAAEFFGQVLHFNKGLKEFHAQQYQLDFRDMEIFVDGLMMNRTLQLLDLNNNKMGDDGVEYLCKYLKTNPPLSGLMIGSNNITDIGAKSLSANLPFSNVKLLDITNNRVTDTGFSNILHTIDKTVKMKRLFVWGNKFTHTSLAILDMLFNNGTLERDHVDIKIYLTDNGFTAAWNSSANMYTHRFYCVSDYGHPPMRKVTKNPPKPEVEPDITFKHHVDDKDLGIPVYGF